MYNDRAGEVGRTLNARTSIQTPFWQEGVQLVHLASGAALSPETSAFCLEVARTAKKHGTLVSFDLNYRASFWENREEDSAGYSLKSPA